jgi:hypothetical protein
MEQLWNDAPLRARLSEAGMERSARYDWDRTAAGLWQSIEMVLRQP